MAKWPGLAVCLVARKRVVLGGLSCCFPRFPGFFCSCCSCCLAKGGGGDLRRAVRGWPCPTRMMGRRPVCCALLAVYSISLAEAGMVW